MSSSEEQQQQAAGSSSMELLAAVADLMSDEVQAEFEKGNRLFLITTCSCIIECAVLPALLLMPKHIRILGVSRQEEDSVSLVSVDASFPSFKTWFSRRLRVLLCHRPGRRRLYRSREIKSRDEFLNGGAAAFLVRSSSSYMPVHAIQRQSTCIRSNKKYCIQCGF